MKINIRFLSVLSLAVMLALTATGVAPVAPARAAALIVNSLNDVDDGTCNGTHCSLREAIDEANTLSSDDTITFSVSGTIPLASILPTIDNNGSLTIDGGNNITISGDTDSNGTGDVRVLSVPPNANLTLRNITVTKGMNTIDSGGAIKSYGNLTIENSTISNSSTTTAVSVGGGGVFTSSSSATLTVTNSTFSGNTATYFGGGIYNAGSTVSISNSTFSGNQSTANSGGGIYNSTGSLTITDSTFSSNMATAGGGSIYNNTGSGAVSVTGTTFSGNQANSGAGIHATNGVISISNSTFSNNSVTNDAGGIYVTGSGLANITNSTFSGNSTSSRGGGIFSFGSVTLTNVTMSGNTAPSGDGGGVHTYGALTLKNTIIANGGTGGDCILSGSGSIAGGSSHNLIEDSANACGLTNGVSNNIVGSDPNLGVLTGSPAYFPLNLGSPSIDAGDDTVCEAAPVSSTSQNGLTRPQGSHCDIGSYEGDFTPPTVTMTSLASNPTNTSPIPVTVQFSETVTGFLAGDITPGNGSVDSFVAVDGDTYTFNLTPSAQGPVTADIAAGVASDSVGNANTAATQFSRTYSVTYYLFLPLILR
ncbi:MAG: Ig-like domain-containing protein [Anaerolineales bacterium]|nr:Ig-like domain-containing protein [Anaerolineales bacterium]